MELLLSSVWNHLCESLWKQRNEINNSKNSASDLSEMRSLEERLLWYKRHNNEVLDYRHRFLADFTEEDIKKWTKYSRRAKLELLHNARKFYETECSQHSSSQSTIFDWIHSFTELRSGRLIGPGLTNAWAPGKHPRNQKQDVDEVDDEGENEFDWTSTKPLLSLPHHQIYRSPKRIHSNGNAKKRKQRSFQKQLFPKP